MKFSPDLTRLAQLKCLLSIEGLGPAKILNLISKFNDINRIYSLSSNNLLKVESLGKVIVQRIIEKRKELPLFVEKTKEEIEKLNNLGIGIYSYFDKEYPDILKNIYAPPLILYQKGQLLESDKNSLAVVGTRRPTNYGKQQTEIFVRQLIEKDFTIVSGLARGIDSIAHSTALNLGGRTIAVIGSGIDVIYPPENKKLFHAIIENGAVISEYPLGTKPDAQNFPKRNRIISGLSLGTLVVQTQANGGAMHTASYAFDQNRDLFAIPGNLGIQQSEGTNLLIRKNKAKLVQNVEDIIEELDVLFNPALSSKKEIPLPELSLFEQKIFDNLKSDPIHIDRISKLSKMNTSDCLVNLLSLEFKGVIKQYPGMLFSKLY